MSEQDKETRPNPSDQPADTPDTGSREKNGQNKPKNLSARDPSESEKDCSLGDGISNALPAEPEGGNDRPRFGFFDLIPFLIFFLALCFFFSSLYGNFFAGKDAYKELPADLTIPRTVLQPLNEEDPPLIFGHAPDAYTVESNKGLLKNADKNRETGQEGQGQQGQGQQGEGEPRVADTRKEGLSEEKFHGYITASEKSRLLALHGWSQPGPGTKKTTQDQARKQDGAGGLEDTPAAHSGQLEGGSSSFGASAYSGPVIINFFASWCRPCKEEHPVLMKLSARSQIPLIGIAFNEKREDAQAFLKELGNPYDASGLDRQSAVSSSFVIEGIPSTFILDKNSKVVHRHDGPLKQSDLSRFLKIANGAASQR